LPGLVGSVVVVVPVVFSEDLSGVCFVEDQDVVADLVAEGSDDPFAVCVHRVSRTWKGVCCRQNFLMWCCVGDEGLWPFGVALRGEASNHLMLR
jgi:hypothetical protein